MNARVAVKDKLCDACVTSVNERWLQTPSSYKTSLSHGAMSAPDPRVVHSGHLLAGMRDHMDA